jgi:hypothetical protein
MAVRMEVTLLSLESARLTYHQLANPGQEALDIVRVGYGLDGREQQLFFGVSR